MTAYSSQWFDKEALIRYYEDLLAVHGDHHLSLDWKSDQNQTMRFVVLKELFYFGKKQKDFSVLDLGCGFGDFYRFLKKEGLIQDLKIRYTGYDIAPGILEVAKKKYPEAAFEIKDVLAEKKLPRFDYVVASGLLSICLVEEEAHLDFVREMIARLYDISTQGVGINFLSIEGLPYVAEKDKEKGKYYYFKPEFVAEAARKIAPRFVIRHDYYPADFTLYMLKER